MLSRCRRSGISSVNNRHAEHFVTGNKRGLHKIPIQPSHAATFLIRIKNTIRTLAKNTVSLYKKKYHSIFSYYTTYMLY